MANKSIFKSAPKGKTVPPATHVNRAGGVAYKLSDKAALAQYASTGTFNDTFYATGKTQVDEVLALLPKVDVEFIAKTAVYAHEQGRMKDMPALLAAHLAARGEEGVSYLKRVFPLVISNGKMLRNFVQIIRSGAVGRKSLGTALKKLVAGWFESKSPDAIFKMSTGNDPSMGDVIKLARPRPSSDERRALYGYLAEVDPTKTHKTKDNAAWGYNEEYLPLLLKQYNEFKKDPSKATELPKVPFEMLMGLPLSDKQWELLADQMSWTQLRMNLNTLSRHGVFKNDALAKALANKLSNPDAIRKAKPFPYQLLVTYLHTSEVGEEATPRSIRNALHIALDVATENVLTIDGPAHALIDVSGSMQSPVSGYRAGSTSKARCVDAAALLGSAFLKRNPESSIIAYSDNAITNHGCIPQDSVLTNAEKLARLGGGGTNLGAAFSELNKKKAKGNLVVVCSDMETWMDGKVQNNWMNQSGTVSAQQWAEYKSRNPKAKLVCINLAAGDSCQVASNTDVLNIGGFSDSIWEVIKSFVEGMPSADHWVKTIEAVTLPEKV